MIHPLSSLTTMPSSHCSLIPRRLSHKNPNHIPNPKPTSTTTSSSSSTSSCNHSPSATLDLLILILVLLSCTFLITSSFSHIFRSLSHILPLFSTSDPLPFLAGFLFFIAAFVAGVEISCYRACIWSRRCENPRCRGLKKAMEFDVQIQTDDCIRFISSGSGSVSAAAAAWKEIDELPWKGGEQGKNPDYECLRAELRRMAPLNGRAVLLFRARCGCPVAKLEAWSQKRGRRHKKVLDAAAQREDRYAEDSDEKSATSPDNAKRDRLMPEICVICLEQEYNAVFVPCGHMCCCTSCSSQLTNCPLCRRRIDQAQRTFRH